MSIQDYLPVLGVPLLALVIVVSVAWLILPFAIFGLKKRADETNRLLKEIGLLLEQRLEPKEPRR